MQNLPEFKKNDKKRLGKGLSSLLGNIEPQHISGQLSGKVSDSGMVAMIPTSQISPSSEQPRKIFEDGKTQELIQSIQKNGILQPIIVKDLENGEYKIIAGERRYRAAKAVGLSEIPCIVKTPSELQTLAISLTENLQRENLNPIEECGAYIVLAEKFGQTQEDIAKLVGKSRSYIANTVRLDNLPPEVKVYIIDGKISTGHAKALLSLPTQELAMECANVIIAKGLNVRETESLITKINNNHLFSSNQDATPTTEKDDAPEDILNLEDQFNAKYSSIMHIKPSRGNANRGVIKIKYSSKDEMYEILGPLVDLSKIVH